MEELLVDLRKYVYSGECYTKQLMSEVNCRDAELLETIISVMESNSLKGDYSEVNKPLIKRSKILKNRFESQPSRANLIHLCEQVARVANSSVERSKSCDEFLNELCDYLYYLSKPSSKTGRDD